MTNEEQTEQELLQKAVEEAVAMPVPEEAPKEKLWLHQTARIHKRLKGNTFPLGQKSKPANLPKLDASGETLKLPNGGAVLTKDYSNVKFWHEGKLISKAEHDELTNGIK